MYRREKGSELSTMELWMFDEDAGAVVVLAEAAVSGAKPHD